MPATIPVNKLDLKPEVSRQAAANKLPLSTPAGNVRHVGDRSSVAEQMGRPRRRSK